MAVAPYPHPPLKMITARTRGNLACYGFYYVSKSAHLIWVLRCERDIQETLHTNEAVKTRWYNKINHRLSLDRYIASKWNRKPITQEIVKRTWYPSLLQTSPDLTEDWVTNSEVLVGIKPP